MVQLAHQLVAQNQLSDAITICQKRSDDLLVSPPSSETLSNPAAAAPDPTKHTTEESMTCVAAKRKKHAAAHQAACAPAAASIDMPCKADVIVTEIFDSELLGEGVLPTMRHAVKHLLQVCYHIQQQLVPDTLYSINRKANLYLVFCFYHNGAPCSCLACGQATDTAVLLSNSMKHVQITNTIIACSLLSSRHMP